MRLMKRLKCTKSLTDYDFSHLGMRIKQAKIHVSLCENSMHVKHFEQYVGTCIHVTSLLYGYNTRNNIQ